MPNSFGNPIVLTEAMRVTWRNTDGHNAPANQGIRIKKIIWDGGPGQNASDTFALEYGDGTPFCSGTASSTNPTQPFDYPGGLPVSDFRLSQLSSGKILIHYY